MKVKNKVNLLKIKNKKGKNMFKAIVTFGLIFVIGIGIGFISSKYIAIKTALKPVPYSSLMINSLKIQKDLDIKPMENLLTSTWSSQSVCLDIKGDIEIVQEHDIPELQSLYGKCISLIEFRKLLKYYIDNTKTAYEKVLDGDI